MTAVFQQPKYDEGQQAARPTAAWASSGACRCVCGGEGSTFAFEAYMPRAASLPRLVRRASISIGATLPMHRRRPCRVSQSFRVMEHRFYRRHVMTQLSPLKFLGHCISRLFFLSCGCLQRDLHSLCAVQVPAEPALIAAVRSGDEESAKSQDRRKLCEKVRCSRFSASEKH